MKKFFTIITAAFVLCASISAQDTTEIMKNRKAELSQAKSELSQKASKSARKEAKRLAKEGWIVAPGGLPMEKQLDKSYLMQYEIEENGRPKYIFGQAMSVGSTYDAAKMQATNNAKIELAGLIETEITALTESTLQNSQISLEQAASVNEAVQMSKSLIANKLGRMIPAMECYRKVNKNSVEVQVRIGYNTRMAMEAAKEVIKMKLEEKGQDLHEQLDKMWSEYR